MDPLSITASVVAIIQISTKIISICSAYIRDVKDAPSDLQKIMFEVAAVKGIFEALSLLFTTEDNVNAAVSQRPYIFLRESVDGCAQELKTLEAMFPRSEDSSSNTKRRRKKCQLSLSSLAWPLKAHRAKQHLENISQHKAIIILALTTKSCLDISKVSGKIDQIQDNLSSNERQDTLNWLVTTDPSSNHNRACELHEPYTGKWLTRAPEYAKMEARASYIVKDAKIFCKDSALENTGWAYYYCYFGHQQDETPHLLRWVINQLCRQINAIPDEVRGLFSDGGSPQTQELTVALGAVLRNYHRVYLVIDALDESLERHRVLNLLLGILDDHHFEKLQVLATSRKELDIERALLNSSVNISMSNRYVDKDIRVYIQNTLQAGHKFSRWPEELREEIEMALVKGAKGMFRWAFCQLDILKRLNTVQDIRKALGELPRTLDETYERILCNIPPENHSIAYRTLQLLACETGAFLRELSEALAVDVERCTFHREDRILDPEALLEVCTCLITIISDPYDEDEKMFQVELAHYTVKEYLLSDRIGHGSAIAFQMSEDSANLFTAKCLITHMLHEAHHRPHSKDMTWDFGIELMHLAQLRWSQVIKRMKSHDVLAAITPMVLRLLDVTSPHFQRWIETSNHCLSDLDISNPAPEWTVPPGRESCLILAYLCYFDLVEVAHQFVGNLMEDVPFETEIEAPLVYLQEWDDTEVFWNPEIIEDGRLLHIAASRGTVSFVDYFISKGANVNAVSARGLSVLGSAIRADLSANPYPESHRNLEMVQLLLKAGADPNIPGVLFTPLQRLMSVWINGENDFFRTAEALLNAGADVNGLGNDESDLSRLRFTIEVYCLRPHCQMPYTFSEFEEEIIANHLMEWSYDSPLRIVDRGIRKTARREGGNLNRLREMEELLLSHGAKSLHRSLIRYPPTYIQARISEHLVSRGYNRFRHKITQKIRATS